VPDLGDEKSIRERLIGILLERLSKGETRTSPDELLRLAELDPNRLRNLPQLPEMMAAIAAERLRRMGYRPDADVRSVPEWPSGKPVLLISGGSGSGKTWQLGQLVTALGEARHIVALEPTRKDTETILRRAMRTIWQDGLGATNEKTPQALTAHYKDMAPHAVLPWLTVAVDDVQDIEVARDSRAPGLGALGHASRHDRADCGGTQPRDDRPRDGPPSHSRLLQSRRGRRLTAAARAAVGRPAGRP
jgi:hypothetical protein